MSQYQSRRRIVADNEPDDLDDMLPEEAQDDEGTPSEDTGGESEEEEDDALDRVFKAKAAIASAAALAERNRITGLMGIVKQAARLGVEVDLRDAIVSGISVKQARLEVLNISAQQAEDIGPIFSSPRLTEREFSSRTTSSTKAKAVWKNALRRD